MELYAKYRKITAEKVETKDKVYTIESNIGSEEEIKKILSENNNDLSNVILKINEIEFGLKGLFEGTDIVATPKEIHCDSTGNFTNVFKNCKSLTKVSEHLLDNCPNISGISGMFNGCSSLTEIPKNLLAKSENINDVSFMFASTKIKEVPEGLFDNCPNLSFVVGAFSSCPELVKVPENLFDKNKSITRIEYTFKADENITSKLPDLWNKEKFVNISKSHVSGYAAGCEKAINYGEIPEEYK